MANIGSRLVTDSQFIEDIVKDIKKGEIKIPKFQRKYIWSTEQALQLLDSIANNYPIGSLLLWRTHDKMTAERNIGDFNLPQTDDMSPTNYVLDGQQRLTVIYTALTNNDNSHGFTAAYDLEQEKFVETTHSPQLSMFPQIHIFPLNFLYDTTKTLNFRTELQSHPSSAILSPRLDTLIKVINSYRIPVVTLKDLTVEEVCPIYERINSSGTRLSVYDLMVAATWSQSFDLNDAYKEITGSLDTKGYEDIEGDTVLKCLAAVHWKQVSRNDILKLREVKSNMDALVDKTKETLLRTIDLLVTEFKVHSLDFLPYEAQLVILCSILCEHKSLDADQVKRVRAWFWRSSFTERYRGASDSFVSNDIKVVRDYVIYGQGTSIDFGQPPAFQMLTFTDFRADSSRSKAFILLLAARSPLNLTNGASIDTTQALSIFNKKQYHHIFPRAFLRRAGASSNPNALANICILSAAANQQISDANPNLYLPDCIRRLGSKASAVFISNFLPDPATTNYGSLDYDLFLRLRAKILQDAIEELCLGELL